MRSVRNKENDPDVLDKQQKLLDIRKNTGRNFYYFPEQEPGFTSETKFGKWLQGTQERQPKKI
jgi:hypothetical protein